MDVIVIGAIAVNLGAAANYFRMYLGLRKQLVSLKKHELWYLASLRDLAKAEMAYVEALQNVGLRRDN